MADYTVVERVSQAIRKVLADGLTVVEPLTPPVVRIDDLRSPPAGQQRVLTLFLYEICEDHTVRNRSPERVLESNGGGQRYRTTRAPMPLILRYLVTPWAGDRATEQLMIGRTMQVLYEHQVHRGANLIPELDLPHLSVTLAPLSLEERTRVWWAIQLPYRLSLNYEVRVVDIDVPGSVLDVSSPVREREIVGSGPEEGP